MHGADALLQRLLHLLEGGGGEQVGGVEAVLHVEFDAVGEEEQVERHCEMELGADAQH